MLPPSWFSPPHRRRGASVSYLLLPHARRVASLLWVLDRRRLRRLRRCGVAAGHAATHARERWPLRRAPWAVRPRGCGPRTRCARQPRRRREHGPRATVQLGRARIRPSDTRFSFSNFRIYSNSCKFKILCRIHLNSENYETNFVGKVLICTRF
jgi:hypothetical protein